VKRRRGPAHLILLVLSSLACSTLSSALLASPTSLPSPTATVTATALPSATASLVPSPTIQPSPTDTPTRTPFPTLTAAPTFTLPAVTDTPDPSHTQAHLRIFQRLWDTVNTRYVYTDFNGHDWKAIGDKYRAIVQADQTDDDFYLSMNDMLVELGDEHSGFESPELAAEGDRALAGENDYAGIGVLLAPVPEKGYATIIVPFKNGPAALAGLKSHDRILAVDGLSLLGADGWLHTEMLRGPAGAPVTLTVQTPGEEQRDVVLARAQITGSVPIDYWLVPGTRIAYILIPTFYDDTISDQIEHALRELAADGPLAGVILDNRVNDGGAIFEGEDVLGLFTGGLVGHFRSRTESRAVRIHPRDVAGSQTVPLAVLVGPGSVSYGEISSGILKDQGRATIVGETTLGNVEVLWAFDFDDGSRAWIAVERFDPINTTDDWEQTGIVPDIVAPAEWDEISGTNDPGLQAAVKALQGS
jgi:carboxyl-terminal processing protease